MRGDGKRLPFTVKRRQPCLQASQVRERRVGKSHEYFRVVSNHIQPEVREDAHRVIPSDDRKNVFNPVIGKSLH